MIQESRKDTEGSTKAKRIQQGTGCLISTYGTAAVVRWEVGGGIFEETHFFYAGAHRRDSNCCRCCSAASCCACCFRRNDNPTASTIKCRELGRRINLQMLLQLQRQLTKQHCQIWGVAVERGVGRNRPRHHLCRRSCW